MALEVVLELFTKDEITLSELVHVKQRRGGSGQKDINHSVERVRMAVWGMLYVNDAGFTSRSPKGPARIMTVIVVMLATYGLTMSEKKMETLLMRRPTFSRRVYRTWPTGSRTPPRGRLDHLKKTKTDLIVFIGTPTWGVSSGPR